MRLPWWTTPVSINNGDRDDKKLSSPLRLSVLSVLVYDLAQLLTIAIRKIARSVASV
jgi:hypothetical protein